MSFHFIVFKMIFLVGAVVVVNGENVSDTKYEGRAFIILLPPVAQPTIFLKWLSVNTTFEFYFL